MSRLTERDRSQQAERPRTTCPCGSVINVMGRDHWGRLHPGKACRDSESFALRNDPAPHRPARFDNQPDATQRVLVEGMWCLAGQLDLF